MGVEYRGVICVGYTFDELQYIMEKVGFEGDAYDFTESENIDSFSPYFDADSCDCIYGIALVSSDDYSYVEIPDVDVKATLLKEKLSTKYGVNPKTYLMAHGW